MFMWEQIILEAYRKTNIGHLFIISIHAFYFHIKYVEYHFTFNSSSNKNIVEVFPVICQSLQHHLNLE